MTALYSLAVGGLIVLALYLRLRFFSLRAIILAIKTGFVVSLSLCIGAVIVAPAAAPTFFDGKIGGLSGLFESLEVWSALRPLSDIGMFPEGSPLGQVLGNVFVLIVAVLLSIVFALFRYSAMTEIREQQGIFSNYYAATYSEGEAFWLALVLGGLSLLPTFWIARALNYLVAGATPSVEGLEGWASTAVGAAAFLFVVLMGIVIVNALTGIVSVAVSMCLTLVAYVETGSFDWISLIGLVEVFEGMSLALSIGVAIFATIVGLVEFVGSVVFME